jgi:hypothetical protein
MSAYRVLALHLPQRCRRLGGGMRPKFACAYSIPGVDTALVRMLEKRQALSLIQNPGLPLGTAIAHGTQNDF